MQTLALAVSELCGGHADRWQSLLDCHGGLLRLADGRADYVAREAGLSPEQARRFAALVDVVREGGAERLQAGAKFSGSADVYAHFRPLAVEVVETFHVVLLDQKHRVLKTVEISRGTLTASLVHPREVYRPAILRQLRPWSSCTTIRAATRRRAPKTSTSRDGCGSPLGW